MNLHEIFIQFLVSFWNCSLFNVAQCGSMYPRKHWWYEEPSPNVYFNRISKQSCKLHIWAWLWSKSPFIVSPAIKAVLTPSFIMDSWLQLPTKLLILSPTCIIFFLLMPKALQILTLHHNLQSSTHTMLACTNCRLKLCEAQSWYHSWPKTSDWYFWLHSLIFQN